MTDNNDRMIRAQLAYNNEARSMGIAYLLWGFLGGLGAHRFYLGDKGIAIAQLVLTLSVVGLVVSIPWTIVDAFLIPGRLREVNEQIWQRAFNWAETTR